MAGNWRIFIINHSCTMFSGFDTRFVDNWIKKIIWLNNIVLITARLGKKLKQCRMKTAEMTDKRIRLINEIISGIKVIKMFTWETPFGKLIDFIRKYLPII